MGKIRDGIENTGYFATERELKTKVILEYDLPLITGNWAEFTNVGTANSYCKKDEVFDNHIENIKNYALRTGFKLDGSARLYSRNKEIENYGSNYVTSIACWLRSTLTDGSISFNTTMNIKMKINGQNIKNTINNITIIFGGIKLVKYSYEITFNNHTEKDSVTVEKDFSSTIYIQNIFNEYGGIDFSKIENDSDKTATLSLTITQVIPGYNLKDSETSPQIPIQINKILMGLVEEYEGTEIIDMNIINQTKKFCEEVPEDECSFTVGNYDRKFDPLVKTNKEQLLSAKTKIKPYIGIVENKLVTYHPMGLYYLSSFENSEDTFKITGKNIFSLIKDVRMDEVGVDVDGTRGTIDLILDILYNKNLRNGLATFLENKIQQAIDPTILFGFIRDNLLDNSDNGSWLISTTNIKDKTLLEFLQKLAVASGCILVNETGFIVGFNKQFNNLWLRPIEKYTKNLNGVVAATDEQLWRYEITLDDMTAEPVITKIDKINKVRIKQTNLYSETPPDVSNYTETTIEKVLDEDYQIIPVFFDNPSLIKEEDELISNGDIAQSRSFEIQNSDGSTSFTQFYQYNNYMIFLNSKLKKGEKYTKKISIANISTSEATFELSNKQNAKDKDIVLEIENELIPFVSFEEFNDNCSKMAQYYLDNATQYEVSFEFFGHPDLEPGNTIKVQTRYGYIYVWVEKTEFNFDGGLTCKVEGVSTGGFINE